MEKPSLSDQIAALLLPTVPKKLAVALSGGGDSMALLVAAAQFANNHNVEIHGISIDHKLRPEAQAELKLAGSQCGRLGVTHHIENWTGWDGTGNLQNEARMARYELITTWAHENKIETVLLGHTADDQAETVLMRLARGAGVDGLAAMSERRMKNGITWLRPFLGESRDSLRKFLVKNNMRWADDPSNENQEFERVRMRKALESFSDVGVDTHSLTQVAQNMADVRSALDWYTFLAAQEICRIKHGVVVFNGHLFRTLPKEIARRLIVHAILWVNGAQYAPRRASIKQLQTNINQGKSSTLDGCQFQLKGSEIFIFREYRAVQDEECEVGDLWDGRWRINGPEDDPDFSMGPLGREGLKEIEDWRAAGLPHGAVLTQPALWYNRQLIAAPTLNYGQDWSMILERDEDEFFSLILSH